MLPAYGAMETNEASPVYRYAKRAYFIIDKTGTVKYVKVMDSPLNLLEPAEVLAAVEAPNPFQQRRAPCGGHSGPVPGWPRFEAEPRRGRPGHRAPSQHEGPHA